MQNLVIADIVEIILMSGRQGIGCCSKWHVIINFRFENDKCGYHVKGPCTNTTRLNDVFVVVVVYDFCFIIIRLCSSLCVISNAQRYTSWTLTIRFTFNQKTLGLLMFSGGSKGNIGLFSFKYVCFCLCVFCLCVTIY